VFILDTNVISELMRPAAAPQVVAWVDAQPARDLFITTITQAEILCGLALLPPGRRRDALTTPAKHLLGAVFATRTLSFDRAAAPQYAALAAAARQAGRMVAPFDMQIAAIALARGLGIATRNIHDFDSLGLTLANPWATPAIP
jgi:predicted nucleic acid-binding protein